MTLGHTEKARLELYRVIHCMLGRAFFGDIDTVIWPIQILLMWLCLRLRFAIQRTC